MLILGSIKTCFLNTLISKIDDAERGFNDTVKLCLSSSVFLLSLDVATASD